MQSAGTLAETDGAITCAPSVLERILEFWNRVASQVRLGVIADKELSGISSKP
jgi:hypothetical protein